MHVHVVIRVFIMSFYSKFLKESDINFIITLFLPVGIILYKGE